MSFISTTTVITQSDVIPAASSWSELFALTDVPDGTIYRLDGFGVGGFSFWYRDGLIWRPMNGLVRVAADMTDDYLVPLASLSAPGNFVLPLGNPIIPGNMAQNGFMLDLRVWMRRSGSATLVDGAALINGLTFGSFSSLNIASLRQAVSVCFGDSDAKCSNDGENISWNLPSTSAVAFSTLAVDRTSDMTIGYSIVSLGGGATTINLLGYDLTLRG